MSMSILLVPEAESWIFPIDQVVRLVRSLWPTANAHRLPPGPFDVHIEVAERGLDIRIGTGLVSISPGSTLDDCTVVAHRIVGGLGVSMRFHYMDSGNNHALLVDQWTPMETFASLPNAKPM